MRVIYPHIFEIRLKSIEFNENIWILKFEQYFFRIIFAYFIILYYLQIIRIFY